MCTECHAIKSRCEARVRRWRDRVFGKRAAVDRPGYVWAAVASGVAGVVWAASRGPVGVVESVRRLLVAAWPFPASTWDPLDMLTVSGGAWGWRGVLLAAAGVWWFVVTNPSGGGLDGLDELEKLEAGSKSGIAGSAARARNWWRDTFLRWRLNVLAVCLPHLVAQVMVWGVWLAVG